MSSIFRILSILSFGIIFILGGCSENKKETNNKIKNLYLETINFTPDLKTCFDDYFFEQRKMDTTWVLPDTVIYRYKDAALLADSNLLDYTKKMRVTLLDKDSVGNPMFSVEVFQTERSEWKRVSNSGQNPMYKDSLMTFEQVCNAITNSTYIYILKFNP